jgi:D-methionine transport system ATP-binding protein
MSIIEIISVSKSYSQAKNVVCALQDVSFNIEKGDVYGIIGLSGAGKSTLIRSLAGLVQPTSGKILFHGKDVAEMQPQELQNFRKNIGMIFQHFNLLKSRTVAGNIAYPLEIAGHPVEFQNKRVEELLGLVGLMEKKEAYPSQLSGGEKQRVGVARALANYPEVLFSDEATSALDPKTTKEILTLLKNINKELGITIVLITHEMEVIKQICNKVAVIDKGRIVEHGPVSQIFSDPRHPITKNFLQSAPHEIPAEFFKAISPNRKLLRLTFKGNVAGEPIMSEIVRKFNVDTNILSGWLDRLQTVTIGTLIIELSGPKEGIDEAMHYLQDKSIHCEVMQKNEP